MPQVIKEKLNYADTFIFDMDGTLIDLEKLNFESFALSIKENLNRELTPEEYQLYFSGAGSAGGFHNYLAAIKGPESKFEILLEDYRAIKRKNLQTRIKEVVTIKKGAVEFLEHAKASGKKLALATSTRKEFTDIILNAFDLTKYFQVILTIEDIKNGKPDPEMYNLALQKIGSKSETSICFEDSINGIKAAKAAGLFTIAILTPGLNDDYVKEADFVVEDFTALKVFARLNSK